MPVQLSDAELTVVDSGLHREVGRRSTTYLTDRTAEESAASHNGVLARQEDMTGLRFAEECTVEELQTADATPAPPGPVPVVPAIGKHDVSAARGLLINVAYRMLGSTSDAEDVVQETFTRWYTMPVPARAEITNPTAWCVRVATRICLDLLKSSRHRREAYVGPWLPNRFLTMRPRSPRAPPIQPIASLSTNR